MELVFCTSNAHKLAEVAAILGNDFSFLTLSEIGFYDDIPEPYNTLEANSLTKAEQVYTQTGRDCFAEDTGLFIDALQGEPGVFSARYAGEPADSQKNMEKVLEKMKGTINRDAFFKTVITLILKGKAVQFEGRCHGKIAETKSGVQGFGYDPIFIPEGAARTFAEYSADEKNAISHRKKAFDALSDYLRSLNSKTR